MRARLARRLRVLRMLLFIRMDFETGDGKSVMLGIQNEREWASFCDKILGQLGLAKDERFVSNSLRVQNRDALKSIICEVFALRTAEDVLVLLDEAAIANASVNDMQGVWNHPQLQARQRWTEVKTPAGVVPTLLPPGMGTDADGLNARIEAVPDVGEHNEAILAELGID